MVAMTSLLGAPSSSCTVTAPSSRTPRMVSAREPDQRCSQGLPAGQRLGGDIFIPPMKAITVAAASVGAMNRQAAHFVGGNADSLDGLARTRRLPKCGCLPP